MSSNQIWETRPLEIWAKAKELREGWKSSIDNSKALLAQGNTGRYDWGSCFQKRMSIVEDNPVGAEMASKSDSFSRKSRLASEIRGWGRELCGYVQNCWGSMFLGYQMDGSPFPMRDLVIPFPDPCDQHLMRGQQAMDYSPIPRWQMDYTIYLGPQDKERDKAMIEHRVQCTLLVINDIERIFGNKFDDEKFIETYHNRQKLEILAMEVSQLMQNVPAPIGVKELYSFYTLGMLTKVDPQETLNFWKELRDEIQWRVDNKIAAVGTERYRWMEAHPCPWHFMKYYRYLEQYGAVCIGSQYSHMMPGPMELNENGQMQLRKLPRYIGTPALRTREDVIRAIYTYPMWPHAMKCDEYRHLEAITDFAKGFKADGAIMPLWRGGVGCTLTRKEQALRLDAMGVRVLHYEGSQPGDRTDMDEKQFLNRIDIWMESQGMRKLEKLEGAR
ncbi:MAG: 2-hydroxyacyl-CoA dehydratase [Clostridiales bacterium]|nr:2-hydroxyacyl-CoA dehydratase [Clostridiales bacterium]